MACDPTSLPLIELACTLRPYVEVSFERKSVYLAILILPTWLRVQNKLNSLLLVIKQLKVWEKLIVTQGKNKYRRLPDLLLKLRCDV